MAAPPNWMSTPSFRSAKAIPQQLPMTIAGIELSCLTGSHLLITHDLFSEEFRRQRF